MLKTCTIVGPGRVGRSLEQALTVSGWTVSAVLGRGDDITNAADGVALVVLAVPDGAIAEVAQAIRPGTAVVAHTSGASDLAVLASHQQVASLHPLVSLPDPRTGARRLLDHCTFAVDGDPIVGSLVSDLGGTAISVPAETRALYHAVACIAANHLAALANQVETLAGEVGVPVEVYWELMSTTLQNVTSQGSVAALTGPASRGDWDTVRKHMAALGQDDCSLYAALGQRAASMAGRDWSLSQEHRVSQDRPTDSPEQGS